MMVINPGGLKGRGSLILNSNSDHHHKYALKPFKIIGPSNANFVIANATSQVVVSALILSLAEMSSLLAISTKRL
jgi:hypothetical protein